MVLRTWRIESAVVAAFLCLIVVLSTVLTGTDWREEAIGCLALFFAHAFVTSQYGKNCIAIGQDETAAQMMGVNLLKTKLIALFISAFYAGIAGLDLRQARPEPAWLAQAQQRWLVANKGGERSHPHYWAAYAWFQ